MNLNFLARLGEFFRSNKEALQAGEITEEAIAQAFRDARASSGGKQKAMNKLNMAHEASKDGDWKVFMEQSFSEPPARIQVLPRPGVYSHPRYGKFTITPEIIQEFVDNHNNHVYQEQIPIDAEHQTKLSGAVGYLGEMQLIDSGKGGATANVEWTDRGRQLLEADAFKYYSPEWFDVWTDPATRKDFNNVLVGGALTTRPFFKDRAMRPLISADNTYQAGEWTGDDEPSERVLTLTPMTFSEDDEEDPKKANLDPSDVHVNTLGDKKKEGGEEEDEDKDEVPASNAGGKSMTEANKEEAPKVYSEEQVEERFKKFNEQLESERGLRTAAESRLATLEQDAQTRRFTDIVMGRDGEGDGSPPFAGEHKPHLTTMSLLAEKFGEDSEQFKEYISQQRSVAKQMREAGLFKEAGVGSGPDQVKSNSAIRRFNDAVDAWAKEHEDRPRTDAIEAVIKAEPRMYNAYIREQNENAKKASVSYGDDEGDDD